MDELMVKREIGFYRYADELLLLKKQKMKLSYMLSEREIRKPITYSIDDDGELSYVIQPPSKEEENILEIIKYIHLKIISTTKKQREMFMQIQEYKAKLYMKNYKQNRRYPSTPK